MKPLVDRIKKHPVLTVCAIALLSIASTTVRSYVRLRDYQTFIHEHYASEIQELEDAMQMWSPDRFEDDGFGYHNAIEDIQKDIQKKFTTGEFHSAAWSYDSHHGARSTGHPDGGLSYDTWLSTSGFPGQILYYGRTYKGKPLLVWQKWIDAPMMRHIVIVFYRDKVDNRMSKEMQ